MNDTPDNEIQLDFGAGAMTPLPSRCLRVAKEPSDCDICAQACPVSAITPKDFIREADEKAVAAAVETTVNATVRAGAEPEAGTGEAAGAGAGDEGGAGGGAATTDKPKLSAKELLEQKLGVTVSECCIHCGICAAVCPLEALTATKRHPKNLEKQLKDKVAEAEGIALSCARSLYGVPPRLAAQALSLPCLADLSTEEWFRAAAQARDAILPDPNEEELETGSLKVYLPPLICEDCPVNVCGDAERAYLATIAEAEAWGADNIELVDEAEQLRNTAAGTLMSALGDVASDDRRELVTQLADGFKRSWKSAGGSLTREKNRAELLAERRKQTKKTKPPDHNAPRPFGKKSQRRGLLRSALEQDETLAEDVELLSAVTEAEFCTGCGSCVSACPLNARRLISSSSVLYFGKLPEDKRPKEKQAAVTDQLCCLGCSACVQRCPTGACTLSWLSGRDFLKLRQN
ncbi:MAG: 4Fe-4S dicluster domain-containing protein [Coriobacteriales bacterium]|nr:4Fe-4S dicluster domain-containing protein [Coriobacteriales bacterium]